MDLSSYSHDWRLFGPGLCLLAFFYLFSNPIYFFLFCSCFLKWPKDDNGKGSDKSFNDKLVGLLAVLFACFSSGFAGVYFEKLLKGSSTSVWMRNIQLGFFGTIIGYISVYCYDYVAVVDKGFFQGYNSIVWTVIALQVSFPS